MSFLGIKTKGGPFGVFQGDAQVVIWLISEEGNVMRFLSPSSIRHIAIFLVTLDHRPL